MSSGLTAAFRIVADAAVYRLRKREGANLVTSMTLAVALSLPVSDIAYRCLFGVLLNLFVYLLNDCFDVRLDLAAPGRDTERTQFLSEHIGAGWAMVAALAVALGVIGWHHSTGLLVAFVANAALITAYSRVLKRWPVVDLVAMIGWGVTMALVGFPIDSLDGWRFAGLLAILCAVTEAIQVIRDADSDQRAGLRTTAVVLGVDATAWVARALIVGACVYAGLVLNTFLGVLFLVALLVPLRAANAARSWDWFRLVLGPTWLLLLAAYRFGGSWTSWLQLG
ncbi:MAG: UbiA family prenyltransferase [Deltaproteobacteria bacterium]|nr:UbiA family prenyltransferase [Deltaproteobacteria bacterium]